MEDMKGNMSIHNLCVLSGSGHIPLIRTIMKSSTDSDHILLIYTEEDPDSSEKAKQAIRDGKLAGCLFSMNEEFIRICARVAYGLKPKSPAPVKKGTTEYELFGEPLRRLMEQADKYDAYMKSKSPKE